MTLPQNDSSELKSRDFWLISGPTASGKTDFAHFFYLFGDFFCIINADSRQFYKDLNIGTAKVSAQEKSKFRYHLLDFLGISDFFSCYSFHQKLDHIAQENSSKKASIVIGGPSLYTDGLFFHLPEVKTPPEIRKRIENMYQEKGIQGLLDIIEEKDPLYFAKMDKKNPRRALRAIEIMEITQKPYSVFRKNLKETKYSTLTFYLLWSRRELYERIEKRAVKMMQLGWLDEARFLWQKHPAKILESINSIGYKHLFDVLRDKISQEEALKKIIIDTWHLAKRQMTWIKKQLRQKQENEPTKKSKIIVFLGEMEELIKTKKSTLKNSFLNQEEAEQLVERFPVFFNQDEVRRYFYSQ